MTDVITLDRINPRVRRIIEEALKAAKPVWVAPCAVNVESHDRLPVYMEPIDAHWVNINLLKWEFSTKILIDHLSLAHDKGAPMIGCWPLLKARHLARWDSLCIAPGNLQISGDLMP